MKKNKKLLMFLALNSLATSFSGTVTGQAEVKYDKLYNNMVKNIEAGKSNEKNYKLIQDVLDKRNRELKDLYVQGDYVVKPEYLEWQIFFTGFYNSSDRGGKKASVSTISNGEAKTVNLGMVIPVLGITKEEINLNLTPVSSPKIDVVIPIVNVNTPIPGVYTATEAMILNPFFVQGRAFNGITGKNAVITGIATNAVAYNNTGTKIYENLNVTSPSGTAITWDGLTANPLVMTGAANYNNGIVTGTTGATENHTGQSSELAINNIGINGDYDIKGDWDIALYSTQNTSSSLGFISYQPNYITTNGSVTYDGTLSLSNESTVNNPSNLLVGMELDLTNTTVTGNPTARIENKGNIIINEKGYASNVTYPRIVGMQLAPLYSESSIKGEVINSGKITLQNTPDYPIGTVGPTPTAILINNGTVSPVADVRIGNIDLAGFSGIGVEISGTNQTPLTNVNIDGSGGVVSLSGSYNKGIVVSAPVGVSAVNGLVGNIKNLNFELNSNNGSAFEINLTSGENILIDNDLIQSIVLGENALNSSLILNNGSNLTIDNSLANAITNNAGSNNIVLANASGTITNYMSIFIGDGTKSGIAISNGYTNGPSTQVINYGDIIINSKIDPMNLTSNSMAIMNYSSGIAQNFANVTMNVDNSVGFYAYNGTVISNTGSLKINGDNNLGIFSTENPARTQIGTVNLESGNIELNGKNGALFYTYAGFVELGSLGNTINAKVNGENSYLIYEDSNFSNDNGKYTINGDVNAEVTNGAIGFLYRDPFGDPTLGLTAYLDKIIDINNGVLNINIDSDAYLLAATNSTLNLSSFDNIQLTGMNLTGSKKTKLSYVTLNVDIDSNLDVSNNTGNKLYRDAEAYQSSIIINSGITVTGTENEQAGIAQLNSSSINNGTINLSGQDSVGIYVKNGNLTNNGVINLESSLNGTGMYTETEYFSNNLENNGSIIVGESGIGIYGNTLNYSNILVNNFGEIIGTKDKSTGIFLNNNGLGSTTSLTLSSTSNIDLRNSKNGIGIYTDTANTDGTDVGTITVGESGIGIYAKNGDTTLNNLTLNLYGDNAVGIYTDGTNSFTGNGTINVDGKQVILFNIMGNGSFNQNFNITSTLGSSYTLGNIKNTTLYSNSSANLSENGVFINGNNSAVLLEASSNLNSNDSNITGIALDGAYIGGIPVVINGQTLNQEATNQGIMYFGNDSTGIYVINGASAENQGIITLGNSSVGIYGSGAGTGISNTNEINIGGDSIGLFLEDGKNITNDGEIKSLGERTAGIYSTNINNLLVSNLGNIFLTGDKSTGIYIAGTGAQVINNAGTVQVGDSSNGSEPSIGIYNNSNNSVVNNTGNIISGKDSIGIYNNGGQINQSSGKVKIGDTGVGIYTNSGSVNLSGGTLEFTGTGTVGIYGINSASIDNNTQLNIGNGNYGVVLNSGADLINRGSSIVGEQSVLVYSDNGRSIINESSADLTMTGSNSIGFYMINGGDIINNASITGNAGSSNIGIYNQAGNITNSGDIKVGDSVIIDPLNPFVNRYAVGLYGEDTQSMKNTGNIEIGADAVGFYTKESKTEALNAGNITSNSDKAIGMYSESSTLRNTGNITLSGDASIGIAAERNSTVKNAGIIAMNGNNSIGIYANANSTVVNENTGKIYINGNDSTGVQLSGGSTLENYGIIEVASGTIGSAQLSEGSSSYTPPSIINAGVIKVDEKFDLSGMNIVIKSDPASFRAPTIEEITVDHYSMEDVKAGFLLTNTVSIVAPSFNFGSNPIGIDPNFTQGTNARVYKFENVFDPTTPGGGSNTGEITVKSGSLTFDAIPVTNDEGKIDVWMEKINYDNFTQGAWYDDLAKNIEENYLNATGDALKLYDKLDLVTDVNDLRSDFSQLAGSMYANINQREQNINEVFDNALDLLQNSENNTKENVKINVIAGKGSTKEDTSGVESYDYETYGVLALREVERTYRHKFGYSLGYTRTDFQMDETNNEDQADTIQLGLHNKYSVNGWNIKNDLLGRVSFHDVDRSINWSGGTKSDLNSNYNVYGVSSINELGKDIEISRNVKVTPYVGLELGYMMHPSFEEEGGAESLKVDSNDAYSVKPNVGIRLEGEKEFGATSSWKVKGNIGVGYEYELGNMNNQEKASLMLVEDNYHELAKPAEDKGKIKTSGYAGVELKGAYGVYVTGEYGIGDDNQEDYKIGLSLKASF